VISVHDVFSKCADLLSDCCTVEKKLVGVTTKSASGGLHTTFYSSSSRDSSSASTSSSDDDSSDNSSSHKGASTSSKLSRQSVKMSGIGSSSSGKVTSQWDVKDELPRFLPVVPSVGRLGAPASSPDSGMGARPALGKGTASRRRRSKKKATPNNTPVVGGPKDVLTTKSAIYASPLDETQATTVLHGKVSNKNLRGKAAAEKHTSNGKWPASEKEKSGVGPGGGCGDGGSAMESDGNGGSVGDSAAPSSPMDTVPDYSPFPMLKGPPRVGDKLAFKASKASSRYVRSGSECS